MSRQPDGSARAVPHARLPVDGVRSPNLPVRNGFSPDDDATGFHHQGPFDVIEMLGPDGDWVIARVPRHPSPKVRRANLRFRDPWKRTE